MRITVIIPTRERADLLRCSLQTCVNQDYDDLEIIVSDNFSQDNTKEVASSFNDSRVRYINTGKRVSMSRNWEFALNHVGKSYLMFLGDDDGLVPGAVGDAAVLIQETGTQALHWSTLKYNWPCKQDHPNSLSIQMKNKLLRCPARRVLRHHLNGRLNYMFGPGIYHGLVNSEMVKQIKDRTGDFFRSVTPDVYSVYALLSRLEWSLYSTRPFSILGLSSRSTGISFLAATDNPQEPTDWQTFFAEIDMPIHPNMELVPGSMSSGLGEAQFQANDACYNGKLNINVKRLIEGIVRECAAREPLFYDQSMRHVEALSAQLGLSSFFAKCKRRIANRRATSPHMTVGLDQYGILNLDAAEFGIKNVCECAAFVGGLLGKYSRPSKLFTYGLPSRGVAYLYRAVGGYVGW